jgi:4'-phosphopantetheinyl transferase
MKLNFLKRELTENTALIFTAHLPSITQNLEELWMFLSDQEKAQAENFINISLKDRYIASHGLLRHLLAFYTGIEPQNIQYSINQFGKPFLKDTNCRIQFNMSHSKDYAAYIIALDSLVGIDIEWKDKTINFQEIAELVLSPTEINIFNKLNPREQFHAFYEIWTKKEAVIKAIGQGLSYPLKAIDIMNSIKNNKAYYVANETTYYYSDLWSLDDYAGAISLTHKLNKIIQIDLANHICY